MFLLIPLKYLYFGYPIINEIIASFFSGILKICLIFLSLLIAGGTRPIIVAPSPT